MSIKTKMRVNIKPFNLADKCSVATKWQALERKADCSVFLSWLWIANWLDLVTDKLLIIECFEDEKLVGLAFFVEKTRKVFGFIPVKQLYLHRTGNMEEDQVWIEYNDFLLDSSVEDAARFHMVQAVCDYGDSIKEIIIGLSCNKILASFQQTFYQSRVLIATQGCSVAFDKIKQTYLTEVLSKNTRSQIRRSEKLLSQLGKLNFSVYVEKDQVNQLLRDISKKHVERWQNTLEGSGFTNPLFSEFHQKVINFDNSHIVQVAVLSIDDNAVGYLLNYVYREQVYFYLSALTAFDESKIKIGLTLHAKAIQFYLDQGCSCYDFLGGEARYKQSLTNQSYDLALLIFFKKIHVLRLENKLKQIKSMLKSWL
jgi:CelD/BcsL family acetyltransferase involved in cellulose biosynthesis